MSSTEAIKNNLFEAALHCISEPSAYQKLCLTDKYKSLWVSNRLQVEKLPSIEKILNPGRPYKPTLVQPKKLARRRLGTLQGRAALLHAICHIEFNAINLAWDAVYRFQDMPREYYNDWISVAVEEANHFNLLNNYLNDLGFEYGVFDAHNGLWELAVLTDHDILVRMGLVPRIMEARGLDVTPAIIEKFRLIKDNKAVEILTIILEEEKGHVRVGNYWFKYICNQRNIKPLDTFKQLILDYARNQIKLPLDRDNRLSSGFTIEELDMLESLELHSNINKVLS